ncbi:hypothetical protein ABH966_004721 [Lysinibacillus sp. RC46]
MSNYLLFYSNYFVRVEIYGLPLDLTEFPMIISEQLKSLGK